MEWGWRERGSTGLCCVVQNSFCWVKVEVRKKILVWKTEICCKQNGIIVKNAGKKVACLLHCHKQGFIWVTSPHYEDEFLNGFVPCSNYYELTVWFVCKEFADCLISNYIHDLSCLIGNWCVEILRFSLMDASSIGKGVRTSSPNFTEHLFATI